VEALSTWNGKTQVVARCLIKEFILWFGIPVSIGSDNGPVFVAEVLQLMAKALGITWELHTVYRSQSSGKVEHMNRTLKSQLGKLCQEIHLQWDQLLPMALLMIISSPTKHTVLSPFEVFYGCPSPLIKGMKGDLKEIGDLTLR
jgi:transposase InsO family protein